ncbi:MAG: hypothetical protein OIF48_06645 [Silicimonas sp.]|nr:hypothetical protein [Silicimonas sp.]
MTKLTAIATAATLGLMALVPAAQAMESELNALTGAVYNELNGMQMDLAEINDLTLGDIHAIKLIMSGGDSEGEKRNKINSILRKAGQR